MPKYLHIGTYTREGSTALGRDGGSKRAAAVRSAVEALGGAVECIYWDLGGNRVFAVIDLSDDVTATALNVAANAAGALELETVKLHTAAELDRAAEQSAAAYPPGVA
jgi:uncharacterized protein with GYD domain